MKYVHMEWYFTSHTRGPHSNTQQRIVTHFTPAKGLNMNHNIITKKNQSTTVDEADTINFVCLTCFAVTTTLSIHTFLHPKPYNL